MPPITATPLAVAAKHEHWVSAGPSSAVSAEGPFLRIVTAGPTSAEDTTLTAHSKVRPRSACLRPRGGEGGWRVGG